VGGGPARIAAVARVGSHARGAATAASDIDLVLLVHGPRPYLDDTHWVERFRAVRQQQVVNYGRVTSLRVWYQDGREVEYGLTDETWTAAGCRHGAGHRRWYARPVRAAAAVEPARGTRLT